MELFQEYARQEPKKTLLYSVSAMFRICNCHSRISWFFFVLFFFCFFLAPLGFISFFIFVLFVLCFPTVSSLNFFFFFFFLHGDWFDGDCLSILGGWFIKFHYLGNSLCRFYFLLFLFFNYFLGWLEIGCLWVRRIFNYLISFNFSRK